MKKPPPEFNLDDVELLLVGWPIPHVALTVASHSPQYVWCSDLSYDVDTIANCIGIERSQLQRFTNRTVSAKLESDVQYGKIIAVALIKNEYGIYIRFEFETPNDT